MSTVWNLKARSSGIPLQRKLQNQVWNNRVQVRKVRAQIARALLEKIDGIKKFFFVTASRNTIHL